MVIRLILLNYVSLCVGSLNAILYDTFSGKPVNKTQLKIYTQRNNTEVCTVEVKPCDPEEWQRVDGSCNNLKYPSRGTHRTPTVRLLPFDFSPNYAPRKAADGGDLELAGRLRTELLSFAKATDLRLTQLVSYYLFFMAGDINSLHDVFNNAVGKTNCCTPGGKNDYRCTPVKVPRYDPVHRYSGVSCMNLTRPQSFQTFGCLDIGTEFARIVFQTPVFDLSNTYNSEPGFIDLQRTFKSGLLKIEKENGLLFPPSDPDSMLCILKQPPMETRCHKYQENTIIGPNIIGILFYRQHNKIAEELHKLNPSWNDERLFFTARDINIAISLQIFLYELLPILLGRSNMIREGMISCDGGFRDLYDENIPPQMSDEYVYMNRWFHTIQETTMKFYDKDGYFAKTFPMVNATTRTGLLAIDDNLLQILQGSFRQLGSEFDYTIDHDQFGLFEFYGRHATTYDTHGKRWGGCYSFASGTTRNSYNEPRKAADGGDLELPRRLRTELLSSGKATDLRLTQLVSYYLFFMAGDINSLHDVFNYAVGKTNCCTPEGKNDYRCTPIKVPRYDPVHRYSGVSCMNLTRPQSFQTFGCLDIGTEFARIVFQTPVFDLSNTYNSEPGFIDLQRTFKNGLLKIEKENGFLFPPSDPDSMLCILNQPPMETRCYKYQENTIIGPNIIGILFYRQHNKIAEELHKLNPSWNDERLFFTARDINIAISLQIFLYELLPILLGRSNMIREGMISCDGGFRDLYDENIPPQMSDEYVYMNRWFHTIQETTMKFYDKDGYFAKTFPMVNATTRTGLLAIDDNLLLRQLGSEFDYTIDHDMGNRVFGGIHFSADVAASDLLKGRLFGFPPYVKYKEFCTKRSYKSFSDLKDSFSSERLYRLMQNYKSVTDIDLMGGLWAENYVVGGMVPKTMYCVVIEQLKLTIASSKHWYENLSRPHAFTKEQLKAIRKVTIAGMLCLVGDHVSEIQSSAFKTITANNPLMKCSCSKIGKLDLSGWREKKTCEE